MKSIHLSYSVNQLDHQSITLREKLIHQKTLISKELPQSSVALIENRILIKHELEDLVVVKIFFQNRKIHFLLAH